MGNFQKNHSLPTFEERKASKKTKVNMARWYKADAIVDEVYCDMVNGAPNSEIILKFKNKQYLNQDKPLQPRTAYEYIDAARSRLRYDFENDMKELRNDIYGKLLSVYQDAVYHNDRKNALDAVGKIMKLGGIEAPQTKVDINNEKNGVIKISFGFNANDTQEGK